MSERVKEKSLFSTVGMIMIITLTSKVMGLIRERMIGVHYGTDSIEGIAFAQASFLPRQFLDIMFAAVFSASFVPIFNQFLEKKGKKAAFDLAARFIAVIGFLTLLITIVSVIFAAPIYTVFMQADYADPEISVLAIRLLRMLFPLMILSGLAFSMASVLHSVGEFNIPAAMSVAYNGVILIYFFFFIDKFGVYGLAAAFMIGWVLQIAIQVPFLLKKATDAWSSDEKNTGSNPKSFLRAVIGYLAVWKLWRDEGLRDIAKLALPVMIATWVSPVNLLINGRASVNLYGGEHGFMAITFAHTLYTIITGIFVLALANVLLPKLSKLAVKENMEEFAAFLRNSLRVLVFLLLPMSFGIMAIANPLVRLAFEGGLFQETSVDITATALFFLSMGILGFGLQIILSRACYALKDGRAPLITAVIAIVINFALSFTLAPHMEIGGPALASAIAISAAAAGLFVMLRKKLNGQKIWTWEMSFDAVKMLVMAVVVFFTARYVLGILAGWLDGMFNNANFISRVLLVAIPSAIGAAVYMVGCFILRVNEALWLFRLVREKILPPRQPIN